MKKTMVEILIETGNSYTKNTRSLNPTYVQYSNNPKCLYNGPNGVHCGVARCCIDPATDLINQENKPVDELFGLELMLKPEYRGYTIAFWADVQLLHDSDRFWDENGLSEVGKARLKSLCEGWGRLDS